MVKNGSVRRGKNSESKRDANTHPRMCKATSGVGEKRRAFDLKKGPEKESENRSRREKEASKDWADKRRESQQREPRDRSVERERRNRDQRGPSKKERVQGDHKRSGAEAQEPKGSKAGDQALKANQRGERTKIGGC